MFIAKNLKRLRLEKGLTQEELAQRVGVTGQAVSKWERDECYPDITLLPGLANIFGVTVDGLLGMEAINDREKLWDIHAHANTLCVQGKYRDAAVFLEEALKTYPSDHGLLDAHAISLVMAGDDPCRAIEVYERMMAEDTSDKHRGTIAAVLCYLYHYNDMTKKAALLARSRPHAVESRELLLPDFLPPEQRGEYLRKYIPGILIKIRKLIDGENLTQEERLRAVTLGTDICDESIDLDKTIDTIIKFLNR
ncbi:MAG: helix-turn-helix domain-containing protein [Oscillospiraceae bacterium]|nr:helix-turn-helix domain-containing protein [Oscillospiraceae bacterium]